MGYGSWGGGGIVRTGTMMSSRSHKHRYGSSSNFSSDDENKNRHPNDWKWILFLIIGGIIGIIGIFVKTL